MAECYRSGNLLSIGERKMNAMVIAEMEIPPELVRIMASGLRMR